MEAEQAERPPRPGAEFLVGAGEHGPGIGGGVVGGEDPQDVPGRFEPVGERGERQARVRRGPGARQAQGQRQPGAHGDDPLRGPGLGQVVGDEPAQDRRGLLAGEHAERDGGGAVQADQADEPVAAGDDGEAVRRGGQERPDLLGVARVVEHDEDAAARQHGAVEVGLVLDVAGQVVVVDAESAQGLPEGGPRPGLGREGVEAAQVEVEAAVGEAVGDPVGPLERQGGLADPAHAADDGEPGPARALLQGRVEPLEFALAAGEAGGGGLERERDRGRPRPRGLGGRVGLGVVAEDPGVDLAQFAVRVETEPAGLAPLHLLEALQGLAGAARGVEGAHELGGEALPVGVAPDGPAQFAEQPVVLARFQFEVEALLQQREAVLLQGSGDRLDQTAGHAAQGRSAPFTERVPQPRQGPFEVPGFAQGPRTPLGGLAAQDVEFGFGDVEAVGVLAGGLQARFEQRVRPADLADEVLDLLLGVVGEFGVLPQAADEAGDPHGPVRLVEQHDEHFPGVAPWDGHRFPVDAHLEGSEQAGVECRHRERPYYWGHPHISVPYGRR